LTCGWFRSRLDRHAESRMRSAPSRQWQAPLGKKLRTTPCKVGA
jgi:hypothetical protein